MVNGQPQAFTPAAANGDTTGREWILSWSHPPYPIDDYAVQLTVAGGSDRLHRFRVLEGAGALALRDVVNFTNPFEDDLGTHFSFFLVAGAPVDVLVRVFTVSGRLVYERIERGLASGYHQLAWDGRDAEGDKLGNGVYLCRVIATVGSEQAVETLRLVKTRKPRRGDGGSGTE